MRKTILRITAIAAVLVICALSLVGCASELDGGIYTEISNAPTIVYDSNEDKSRVDVSVRISNPSDTDAVGFEYVLYFYGESGELLHEELVSYPSESLTSGNSKTIRTEYTVSGSVSEVQAAPYSLSVENEGSFTNVLSNIVVYGIIIFVAFKIFVRD